MTYTMLAELSLAVLVGDGAPEDVVEVPVAVLEFELELEPTNALALVARVVPDCIAHEIPPITWARYRSSWHYLSGCGTLSSE